MSLALTGGAMAASITNKDAQSQILIVTEVGDKIEMAVEAKRHCQFLPVRLLCDDAVRRP